MIPRATLRIIVLVSCAHSMVHIYEFALPSVEQMLTADYAVGKETAGWLATTWRLPFGLGALIAGWLVDRFGERRMLALYLLGCAATAVLVGSHLPLNWLFAVMFLMGLFASIYHPAGLALISHETTAATRPRALGIHGIFGSCGIGLAPFLAGAVLSVVSEWEFYFVALSVPGVILGTIFVVQCFGRSAHERRSTLSHAPAPTEDDADWSAYFALTVLAMMMGFTYSAVLSFLPRYIDGAGVSSSWVPREGMRNYLASAVLFIGCLGQYTSGRFARTDKLERQLAGVSFASAPCLLWMAVASGPSRLVATGMFSLVHFMHQPLYNSLIAKYSSITRRSLAYGFSFAAGMSIGSLGALFAGLNQSDFLIHATLAALAIVSGCWMIGLDWHQRSTN